MYDLILPNKLCFSIFVFITCLFEFRAIADLVKVLDVPNKTIALVTQSPSCAPTKIIVRDKR